MKAVKTPATPEWASDPLVAAVQHDAGDLMRAIRRDLHAHPELGFEEHRTAAKVRGCLRTWGIPVIDGFGDTAVVGVLEVGTGRPSIGLRADMDALPIHETNTFAHRSLHPGRMHACGHDGHTAMLLGAAHYLRQHPDFNGRVYLIFQPAEENGCGARAMIEAGLLRDHPMQAVFGMHNWPGLPAGQFALTAGPIMASSSRLKVTYFGKGGHAALPEQAVDPLAAVAALYQTLQTVVSRNLAAHDSVVLSVTQMQGSDNHCVIADHAWLAGSLRTLSPNVLERVCTRIHAAAQGVAQAYACTVQVELEHTVPATINSPHETALCREAILQWLGPKWLHDTFTPTMGAEDFAFMLQAVPGCYLMLGNGSGRAGDSATVCGLHNPGYDFNDDIAVVGAAWWIRLVSHCLPACGRSPLVAAVR